MGIFTKLRDMVVGDPAAAELERMELEQARRLAQAEEAADGSKNAESSAETTSEIPENGGDAK